MCVCVCFFLRWLLMSRGQSSDLICLSQHVDWIEWPERDTEGRRASWQLSISHYSVENMKQVFGWFSCLLAQSSRRFQLTRASCINERVPVRSAGIGRWTALLQLFHLQNNGKIQRLPHSLCLSFFFHMNSPGALLAWRCESTLCWHRLWPKWNCIHYKGTYQNHNDYCFTLSPSSTFQPHCISINRLGHSFNTFSLPTRAGTLCCHILMNSVIFPFSCFPAHQ